MKKKFVLITYVEEKFLTAFLSEFYLKDVSLVILPYQAPDLNIMVLRT